MSSLKYHIHPKTGQPKVCYATIRCPFGSLDEHYSSKEDALEAYEKKMGGSFPLYHMNFDNGEIEVCPDQDRDCSTSKSDLHSRNQHEVYQAYREAVNYGEFPPFKDNVPFDYYDTMYAVRNIKCSYCDSYHDIRSEIYRDHLEEQNSEIQDQISALEGQLDYLTEEEDIRHNRESFSRLNEESEQLMSRHHAAMKRAHRSLQKLAGEQSMMIDAFLNTTRDKNLATSKKHLEVIREYQNKSAESFGEVPYFYYDGGEEDLSVGPRKFETLFNNLRSGQTVDASGATGIAVRRNGIVQVDCELDSCKEGEHNYDFETYKEHYEEAAQSRLRKTKRKDQDLEKLRTEVQAEAIRVRVESINRELWAGTYKNLWIKYPDFDSKESEAIQLSLKKLEDLEKVTAYRSEEYDQNPNYTEKNPYKDQVAYTRAALKVVKAAIDKDQDYRNFSTTVKVNSNHKDFDSFLDPDLVNTRSIRRFLTEETPEKVAALERTLDNKQNSARDLGYHKKLRETPLRELSLEELSTLERYEKLDRVTEVEKGMRWADSGIKQFFGVMEQYEVEVKVPTQKMLEIENFVRNLSPESAKIREDYLKADALIEDDPDHIERHHASKIAAEEKYRTALEAEERNEEEKESKFVTQVKEGLLDRLSALEDRDNPLDLD